MEIRYEMVQTNGIRLHCAVAGPEKGEVVLLLHGFPDFWYGWRHQIEFLAEKGYRVIAPDQRGYNLSDKPEGIPAYNIDVLAADIAGLLDAVECPKAFVVGHDWGGIVSWRFANRYPQRLRKLVILNVPHPAVIKRALRRSWKQRLKSWYMFYFQIPRIPEWTARLGNWRLPTNSLKTSSRPGTFPDEVLQKYREAWSQPGAFRSMIHWYRALFQTHAEKLPSLQVTAPTLLLWGIHDKFLGAELAQSSIELCDEGRLVFFEDTTHWIQHEQADRVNDFLFNFFKESSNHGDPETRR